MGEKCKDYGSATRDKTQHLTESVKHRAGAIKGALHEARVAYRRELGKENGDQVETEAPKTKRDEAGEPAPEA